MGSLYLFECRSCGYNCQVSGGDDLGMMVRTTTIICSKCKELYDVVVSDEPWREDAIDAENLRCPKSKRHKVEKWEDPGSCPKCGQKMKRGEHTLFWD